jgi:ankyrin repeat protein
MAAAWTQERIDALLCGLMYAQDLRDDDARWQTVIYAMEREGLCVNAQTSAKSYYYLKAGWTLLHVAARQTNVTIIKTLLRLGAISSSESETKLRPIHMVVASRASFLQLPQCLEAVQLLPVSELAHVDVWGRTPLHIAVECLNIRAVEWMLQQPQCCPEITDVKGRTAQDYAFDIEILEAAFATGMAQRWRWTPARAAWMAACMRFES